MAISGHGASGLWKGSFVTVRIGKKLTNGTPIYKALTLLRREDKSLYSLCLAERVVPTCRW